MWYGGGIIVPLMSIVVMMFTIYWIVRGNGVVRDPDISASFTQNEPCVVYVFFMLLVSDLESDLRALSCLRKLVL